MGEHEQVEVKIDDDFIIMVDAGMEDVVKNFFHWEIETASPVLITLDQCGLNSATLRIGRNFYI